jgi:AcrR family transcriptional regulator
VSVPKTARKRKHAAADAYHHGSLREALLDAAETLLEESGLASFTLRECARRAGVSHGAPAHHFGDAGGLLAELAATGYDRLTALMLEYRASAGASPLAQLRAAGVAYIDFAVAHRALFQLMFRSERTGGTSSRLQEAGTRAFETFAETLAAAAPRDEAERAPRLLLAWSVVHGFATLLLEGRLDQFVAGRSRKRYAREMGERILALMDNSIGGAAT